jgi:hypothetical protein
MRVMVTHPKNSLMLRAFYAKNIVKNRQYMQGGSFKFINKFINKRYFEPAGKY